MGEASKRYTLVLEQGKVLEDKLLCQACASAFQETDWIEVHESPVFMRGGNSDSEDDEKSDSAD